MRLNKILLAAASALTLMGAVQAEAAAYNGFSMGATAGWTSNSVKLSGTGTSLDKSLRFNQAPFGLFVQYSKSAPQSVFFGIGLEAGYHFGSAKKNLFEGTIAQNNIAFAGKIELEHKRKFYSEIAAKLGYTFSDSVLYGLVALRGTQVENTLSANAILTENGQVVIRANGKKSNKDFVFGFGPGVGFDMKINDKWSVGAEYKFMFEKSVSAALSKENIKMNSHNLMARLSYHF